MRLFIFSCCLCFIFLTSGRATERLSLEATHWAIYEALIEPAQNERTVTINLVLVLTNTGKSTVKVATSSLEPNVTFTAKGAQVHFRYGKRLDAKGRLLIPSEAQFSVVMLNPGESTGIRHSFQTPESHKISELMITYELPELLQERFGLWTGRLTVVSQDQGPSEKGSDCGK